MKEGQAPSGILNHATIYASASSHAMAVATEPSVAQIVRRRAMTEINRQSVVGRNRMDMTQHGSVCAVTADERQMSDHWTADCCSRSTVLTYIVTTCYVLGSLNSRCTQVWWETSRGGFACAVCVVTVVTMVPVIAAFHIVTE